MRTGFVAPRQRTANQHLGKRGLFTLLLVLPLVACPEEKLPKSAQVDKNIAALEKVAADCKTLTRDRKHCQRCCPDRTGQFTEDGVCKCLVPQRCPGEHRDKSACEKCCWDMKRPGLYLFEPEVGCICGGDKSLFQPLKYSFTP